MMPGSPDLSRSFPSTWKVGSHPPGMKVGRGVTDTPTVNVDCRWPASASTLRVKGTSQSGARYVAETCFRLRSAEGSPRSACAGEVPDIGKGLEANDLAGSTGQQGHQLRTPGLREKHALALVAGQKREAPVALGAEPKPIVWVPKPQICMLRRASGWPRMICITREPQGMAPARP